jgi:hypothetical protein
MREVAAAQWFLMVEFGDIGTALSEVIKCGSLD